MKKNIKNFATAFLLMGSSFIFTAVHANTTEPEAVVTFAGYKNTQPVYKLNIKNPENVKLNVIIKDQDGNIMHQEVVEGTEITRNYLFNKEETWKQCCDLRSIPLCRPDDHQDQNRQENH